MSKKSSLKQHLLMVILFVTGNYIFTTSFFSKDIKEKIDNLKQQIGESNKQKNFLKGKSPKLDVPVDQLKSDIDAIRQQNQEFSEQLFGGTGKVLSSHQKVNIITENAQKLNIAIKSSSTSIEKENTVYQLRFTSPFRLIVNLIEKSNDDLGDINVRSISMKNEAGQVFTTVEFVL